MQQRARGLVSRCPGVPSSSGKFEKRLMQGKRPRTGRATSWQAQRLTRERSELLQAEDGLAVNGLLA